MVEGYHISSNRADMDLSVIHGYLTQSYWAKGISFDVVQQSVENSLCFGVFHETNEQVGFARVITDTATFAYLADVFVLEQHRGQGLSKWLIDILLAHPQLQNLRRIALATQDAHSLYSKFGFEPLRSPNLFMERHHPDIYQNT